MYPRLRLPIVLLLLPPDRRQLLDLLLRQGLPDLAHVLPTLNPGFLLGLRLLLLPGLPLRSLLDPQLLQLGQLLSLLLGCQWFLLFFFRFLKFLLDLCSLLLCEVLIQAWIVCSLKKPLNRRFCALEAGSSEGTHSSVVTETHVEEGCHHLLGVWHFELVFYG